MPQLHEILALRKGIKSRAYAEITKVDKDLQREEALSGLVREWEKRDEDGPDFDNEVKRVEISAREALARVATVSAEWINIEATAEAANQSACADVVVDGVVLLENAPVTLLLFLEKHLKDIETLVSRTCTLPPAEEWAADPHTGLYKSRVKQKHRTQKVPKAIVLYPATPEHPAQTQMVQQDEIIGYWRTVLHSGALPNPERAAILERVRKLRAAVQAARSRANNFDAERKEVGAALTSYIFKS